MRRVSLLLLAFAACASFHCRPRDSSSDAGQTAPPAASTAASVAAPAPPVATRPTPATRRTRRVDAAGESFTTERWSFPLDAFDVALEDVHGTTDLAGALGASRAVLVINAGFFGQNGEPLGLAVTGDRVLSRFSLPLSGGVLAIADGRATMIAAESFDGGGSTSFAIQCRPRLVVGGRANVKSDDGQRAERTALCTRDDGRTLEVVLARSTTGGPSLFALARHLADDGCENALNLDGGPSTGAAWLEAGVVREERPRGPVRHAVLIKPRRS
jgi:hypothetical protein